MVTLKTLRWSAMAAMAAALVAPSMAQARPFAVTELTIDLRDRSFQSSTLLPTRDQAVPIVEATSIADGGFTKLDLRVIIREDEDEAVQKMVDQSFRSEPSGCRAGYSGPLDMEDGLRYFFSLDLVTANGMPFEQKVNGTIYPGDRSLNWTNDVFCEFDADLGASAAVLRITGFYYIIQRQEQGSTNIQLRPVTLTEEEMQNERLLPNPFPQ